MDIQIINPLETSDWDHIAKAHPDYTVFHSSAWARVISKTYGHPLLYTVLSENGKPQALLPLVEVNSFLTGKRGVCLPYTDLCTPLVFNQTAGAEILGYLYRLFHERKWKHFEIRGNQPFLGDKEPRRTFYAHSLDISQGEDALMSGFKGPIRQSLRKAERTDLTAEVTHNRQGILDFFELHTLTRRRHGVPPQPVEFFKNISSELIEQGLGSIVLIRLDKKPIAGGVFLHDACKALYKFGASDLTYQHLRANNLMFWNAFRFLISQGIKTLHFGRTDQDNEGLRRFKLGWGADEEEIHYYRFGADAEKVNHIHTQRNQFHKEVFSRLPLSLNRLAGAILYPHLD